MLQPQIFKQARKNKIENYRLGRLILMFSVFCFVLFSSRKPSLVQENRYCLMFAFNYRKMTSAMWKDMHA